MTRVRPLEPEDLPAVTELLESRLPDGPWHREPSFLTRSLISFPDADPELPSLVATDDEEGIAGFIGAQARTYCFRDQLIRGVLCSHLVVASERAGTAAALLLRKLLAGPQAFTFTDTAIDPVARAWCRLGGFPDAARSSDWMLSLAPGRFALRPIRVARAMARAKADRQEAWRRLVPLPALPLQVAGPRLISGAFPASSAEVAGEPATAEEITEHASAYSRGVTLYPRHNSAGLAHAFALIEATTGNRVVSRLVRRAGAPIGWYAYEQRSDQTARVLHLAAPEHGCDAVLSDLVAAADSAGNSILTGRLEPHLIDALGRRLPALGLARRPLFHARDPEIALTLTTQASRLSLLDGEWWA